MEPLISIIVPVYKVEKYLDKCIESLVNQTYTNIEIILVNDGSPDRCPDICEKWKKIEKTGGNTGEFPAGSYLSEPIILAYI